MLNATMPTISLGKSASIAPNLMGKYTKPNKYKPVTQKTMVFTPKRKRGGGDRRDTAGDPPTKSYPST